MKQAKFPYQGLLESFDFGFQTSVSKCQIDTLKEMHWLKDAYNIIYLGPPGIGKSHLELLNILKTQTMLQRSQRRVKQLLNADLVILDEVKINGRFFKKVLDRLHPRIATINPLNRRSLPLRTRSNSCEAHYLKTHLYYWRRGRIFGHMTLSVQMPPRKNILKVKTTGEA